MFRKPPLRKPDLCRSASALLGLATIGSAAGHAAEPDPRDVADQVERSGPYLGLSSPILDSSDQVSSDPNHAGTDKRIELEGGFTANSPARYELDVGAVLTAYLAREPGIDVDVAFSAAFTAYWFVVSPRRMEGTDYWFGPYLTARGSTEMYGMYTQPSRRAAGSLAGADAAAGWRYPIAGGPYGIIELGYKATYERDRGELGHGPLIVLGVGLR